MMLNIPEGGGAPEKERLPNLVATTVPRTRRRVAAECRALLEQVRATGKTIMRDEDECLTPEAEHTLLDQFARLSALLREVGRNTVFAKRNPEYAEDPHACMKAMRERLDSAKQPHKMLTREYERMQVVFEAWKNVRQELCLANGGLVGAIAKWFVSSGIPYRDLCNEGNIGLLRAIEDFDLKKNVKLATYATYWIRLHIQRAVQNQAKTVRIPVNKLEKLRIIRKLKKNHAASNSPEALSLERIAAHVNMQAGDLHRLMAIARAPQQVDGLFPGSDGTTRAIFLDDKEAPQPEDEVHESDRNADVVRALRSLTHGERTAIILMFGLGLKEKPPTKSHPEIRFVIDPKSRGKCCTLEEAGEQMGLTIERVRQIQDRALEKLANGDHPLRFGLSAQEESEEVEPAPLKRPREHGRRRMRLAISEIVDDPKIINALERAGVYTVGDWMDWTEHQTPIPGFAEQGISRISAAIAELLHNNRSSIRAKEEH